MPSKVNSLALLLHSLLLSFVHLVPIESSHSQQHIRLIKIELFGWNSILLSKLWSDWGRSCQKFPRATKVWSWHTNNQTSNALTYETLGRFLSDTDDWLMLKYFTHPIVHNSRFTHLRLANIPMQIRAGAFVGSIQKLKNHHHF